MAQSEIPVKYTRRLLFFAPSRLCVIVFQFNEKGAETRRVSSISVFTSFALLYIQLTITEITGFPDSALQNIRRPPLVWERGPVQVRAAAADYDPERGRTDGGVFDFFWSVKKYGADPANTGVISELEVCSPRPNAFQKREQVKGSLPSSPPHCRTYVTPRSP